MTDMEEFFNKIREKYPFFIPLFDDFFKDFDEFEDIFKEGEQGLNEKKMNRELDISEPIIYGYSVNIDEEGKTEITEFGNIKPNSEGNLPIKITESREPLIDIIDGKKDIKIIVELPGVKKSDIIIEINRQEDTNTGNNSVFISTKGSKEYFKEITLKDKILQESIHGKYNNGILELVLKKDDNNNSVKKRVKID